MLRFGNPDELKAGSDQRWIERLMPPDVRGVSSLVKKPRVDGGPRRCAAAVFERRMGFDRFLVIDQDRA